MLIYLINSLYYDKKYVKKRIRVYNKFLKYLLVFCLGLNGCALNSHEGVEYSRLEQYNRAMFSFNNKVDKYVVRPVAKGYKAITNKYVRSRVSNFFSNIEEPVSAVNHVLQGDLKATGNNLGRFVVNTTLGVAGIFDVATSMGMSPNKTGFDETMSEWCVPDGPFVILPIIGPSTPRSTIGFIADGYSSPAYWGAREGDDEAMAVYYGAMGLKYLNLMAENISFLESLEEGSIDYYEAIKSAFMQNRSKLKVCGRKEGEEQSFDYDFDMDMDEMD
jgi:phospholipid-binding lipoprotein MlaA